MWEVPWQYRPTVGTKSGNQTRRVIWPDSLCLVDRQGCLETFFVLSIVIPVSWASIWLVTWPPKYMSKFSRQFCLKKKCLKNFFTQSCSLDDKKCLIFLNVPFKSYGHFKTLVPCRARILHVRCEAGWSPVPRLKNSLWIFAKACVVCKWECVQSWR